jgi:hypothetical protein
MKWFAGLADPSKKSALGPRCPTACLLGLPMAGPRMPGQLVREVISEVVREVVHEEVVHVCKAVCEAVREID